MMLPTTDNLAKNNQEPNTSHRTQAWLEEHFTFIWDNHFADVARLNEVIIRWTRPSRTRLGTINARGGNYDNPPISEIRINALLQNTAIPESVITQTIAHELAHYTHGFCSPHPRKYDHPHKNNVIVKELAKRNLGTIYLESEKWLKLNWHTHVASSIGTSKRKARRRSHAKKRLSLLSHLEQIFTS